jgi:Cytochrome P450
MAVKPKMIDLPMLDGVLKETMRMYPMILGPLERYLGKEIEFGGEKIPPESWPRLQRIRKAAWRKCFRNLRAGSPKGGSTPTRGWNWIGFHLGQAVELALEPTWLYGAEVYDRNSPHKFSVSCTS